MPLRSRNHGRPGCDPARPRWWSRARTRPNTSVRLSCRWLPPAGQRSVPGPSHAARTSARIAGRGLSRRSRRPPWTSAPSWPALRSRRSTSPPSASGYEGHVTPGRELYGNESYRTGTRGRSAGYGRQVPHGNEGFAHGHDRMDGRRADDYDQADARPSRGPRSRPIVDRLRGQVKEHIYAPALRIRSVLTAQDFARVRGRRPRQCRRGRGRARSASPHASGGDARDVTAAASVSRRPARTVPAGASASTTPPRRPARHRGLHAVRCGAAHSMKDSGRRFA
jgi:hypothetical protein